MEELNIEICLLAGRIVVCESESNVSRGQSEFEYSAIEGDSPVSPRVMCTDRFSRVE